MSYCTKMADVRLRGHGGKKCPCCDHPYFHAAAERAIKLADAARAWRDIELYEKRERARRRRVTGKSKDQINPQLTPRRK